VIVNLGATRNFILLKIIILLNLGTRVKIRPYTLNIVNREPIDNKRGIVRIETY
jgi:hypothetical protein